MVTTLRTCLALLRPDLRWRWAGLIPLVVTTAALETVGAAGIFVLMKILSEPSSVSTLPLVRMIYRFLPWTEDTAIILSFTALIALFYGVKNCVAALTIYLQSKLTSTASAALASTLFRGYLHAPYARYFQWNSAELIRNTTDSAEAVFRLVLVPALNVASESLVLVGLLCVLVATAPRVTIVVLVILLFVLVLLLRLTRRIFTRLGAQEQQLKREILKSLHHSFGGVKEIKVLGRESFFFLDFTTRHRALMRMRARHFMLSGAPRLLIETVFITGMLLVITSLTVSRGLEEEVALVPLLGLFAYAGFRIIPSISRILANLNDIRYGSSVTQRLYNDIVKNSALSGSPVEKQTEELTFSTQIEFRQVSYNYEGSARPVLHDITFTIGHGESIGIVGATGAGKSTLIDLLLGVLTPSTGRITSDGKDIGQAFHSWRKKIGYVPQTVFLIDDTIRRNIALGLKDEEVVDRQLINAMRMAQLEEFISTLPHGVQTMIGERGVRLSGGQRQRVAIARALYHEPELLIFDEATSALDNQTEREVIQAMDMLRGKKTLVIVAHRLSTVRSCNRLIFLKEGRIVACGAFSQLLAVNAEFRRLAALAEVSPPAPPDSPRPS